MTEKELRGQFGDEAVDALLALVRSGQTAEIDPQLFGVTLADHGIEVDAIRLLDAAAEAALVKKIAVYRCPEPDCHRIIDSDAIANHQCPHCGSDFSETGNNPVQSFVYRVLAPTSRSVPWLIAIHGFNTRAPWQEEFSWRIANRFKYHAPVLIYKYGLVRVGVLFRWRHKMLARQLSQRVQIAVAHARENQIPEPPDVIIHSFGSQLFRLVLEMPEAIDLRFGRVIAVGSVIRPDFDWSSYLQNGRIEAVLCQCGSRDLAVPFAQFFIPNAGPAGRHGFTDRATINVRNSQYGHSTALTEGELARNLNRGGLWDRFLREPAETFVDPGQFEPTKWSPALWIIRQVTRICAILLISAAAVLLMLMLVRIL